MAVSWLITNMTALKDSAFICGVGILVMGAMPLSAIAATTEQRSCTFTLAALANAGSADVEVNVIVASREGAARIRVKKSGEYTGTIRPTGAAQTVTFRTPISREIITILSLIHI